MSGDETAVREADEREARARLQLAEEAPRLEEVRPPEHVEEPEPEAEATAGPAPEPEPQAEPTAGPAPEPESRPQAEPEPEPAPTQPPAPGPLDVAQRQALLAELERAEADLKMHRRQEEELSRELSETEERLSDTQQQMAEALERAAERLREIEQRAAEAEQRAERAERLALVRADEAQRAERLRDMLDRIAQAERRASSAEERAREAVEKISEPLPAIDTAAIFAEHAQARPGSAATPATAGAAVSINSATIDELRALGLSRTQAARLIAHRERAGGFGSLDSLDDVPGFPEGFLAELKGRVRL